MKTYQRKINKVLRAFNKGMSKDIAPYNAFYVRQFKRIGDRSPYEAMFLLQLYCNGAMVSAKWLEYHDIVGFGKQFLGRNFYYWLNNAIAKEVHK